MKLLNKGFHKWTCFCRNVHYLDYFSSFWTKSELTIIVVVVVEDLPLNLCCQSQGRLRQWMLSWQSLPQKSRHLLSLTDIEAYHDNIRLLICHCEIIVLDWQQRSQVETPTIAQCMSEKQLYICNTQLSIELAGINQQDLFNVKWETTVVCLYSSTDK